MFRILTNKSRSENRDFHDYFIGFISEKKRIVGHFRK